MSRSLDAALEVSQQLEVEGFRCTEWIGSGGMGVIYRAVRAGDGAEVAIKLLPSGFAQNHQRAELFRREARVAAAVQHPNLVSVSSFGQLPDGSLYLIMELLRGQTLRDCIEQRDAHLTARAIVLMGRELALALAVLHQAHIVHRDLKPSNIMLVPQPVGFGVKLLDFGIARTLLPEDDLTGTGQGFGTARYMSPEQCQSSSSPTSATDLYSLGVLLFEALTGTHPLQPHEDCREEWLRLQVQQAPLSLHVLWPTAPWGLVQLLNQLLHKAPDRRPTALEAAERLAALVELVPDERILLPDASGTALGDATDPPQQPGLPEYLAPFLPNIPDRLGPRPEKSVNPRWVAAWGAAGILAWGLVALGVSSPMRAKTGHALSQARAWLSHRMPPGFKLWDRVTDTTPNIDHLPVPPEGMVFIAGGTFQQGRSEAQIQTEYADCVALERACDLELFRRELPPREVTVGPFFLHQTEVTNRAFVAWLQRGVRGFEVEQASIRLRGINIAGLDSPHSGIRYVGSRFEVKEGLAERPVIGVSWLGAHAFCEELGFSLPTEAEFDYVASRHGTAAYPWGDQTPACPDAVALGRDADTRCPIGSLPAVGSMALDVSPEGVHDLAGSVSEWVLDRFLQSYWPCGSCQNPVAPESDVRSPLGAYRVVRGGSYFESRVPARSSFRSRAAEHRFHDNIGFRCVLRLQPLRKEGL